MNLNEMRCGAWVPDAMICDGRSKNNFRKRGAAILKRWHEQCAERRRIAAMSERERMAHFKATDPYERVLAYIDRTNAAKRSRARRAREKTGVEAQSREMNGGGK